METIIELIGEIILGGALSIWENKNINKYVRYLVLFFLLLFYCVIIVGLLVVGISALDKSIYAGILLITISLFIIYAIIVTLKKVF